MYKLEFHKTQRNLGKLEASLLLISFWFQSGFLLCNQLHLCRAKENDIAWSYSTVYSKKFCDFNEPCDIFFMMTNGFVSKTVFASRRCFCCFLELFSKTLIAGKIKKLGHLHFRYLVWLSDKINWELNITSKGHYMKGACKLKKDSSPGEYRWAPFVINLTVRFLFHKISL